MNRPLIVGALAALALSPLAANAQTANAEAAPAQGAAATGAAAAVTPTVGAKVFGPEGAEVGTIESVSEGNAVVYTGTRRATLPKTAFASGENGLLISMTQAQLNAAVAAAETENSTAMNAALVAEAPVKTRDGQMVGTVEKVEGDNVTLALSDGNPVTVTRQYLTAGADGGLMLTMSAADFSSAVAAASQNAAASSTAAAQTDTSDD